jgi:hypothetical protein
MLTSREYEEFNCEDAKLATEKNTENEMAASMHVEAMAVPDSSNVVECSKILPCCRFLIFYLQQNL